MNYKIRRMREEDIPQVVEIEKIAFSRPWSRSIFKATLLLPYAAYYVAVQEENEFPEAQRILGMCGVKKIFEEGEISNVAVHPDFRGNGIAIRLYESLGFRTEGVRRGYYDHPVEDGLIMWQRP